RHALARPERHVRLQVRRSGDLAELRSQRPVLLPAGRVAAVPARLVHASAHLLRGSRDMRMPFFDGAPDRTRRAVMLPLLAVSLLAAGACKNVLDVELRGRTPAERLNDATLAKTLVNGVIGDLECGWDLYVAATSWISDEFEPVSGNLVWRNWAAKRIVA